MSGAAFRVWGTRSDDRGVSAVIGVILMVAITVAIAATVYIWAGGFGTSSEGPESASATAKVESLDGDPDAEWIKITLTSGDNSPYENSSISASVAISDVGAFDGLCDGPNQSAGVAKCADYFGDPTGDEWEVGSAKWFPCQSGDAHSLSLSVEDTAVLDRNVDCEEAD